MQNATRVTFITHACLKFEGAFGTLLTDPWILNEPVYNLTTWKYPKATMNPEDVLAGVDYIYISHTHEDHFHIPSLDLVPRDMKFLIPKYSKRSSRRDETMEKVLREMGFTNIHVLEPWAEMDLGSRYSFSIVPASEQKYWDWENSGMVLKCPDATFLNMNDCPPDAEMMKRVNRDFGKIDVCFIQYAGVTMFPGCFRLSEEKMREIVRTRSVSFQVQRTILDNLETDVVAPIAGDFAWLDDDYLHFNWSNRGTPKIFEDFVAENYPNRKIDCLVMYPEDRWTKVGGIERTHPEINWDSYLENINAVKDELRHKVNNISGWLRSSSTSDLEARTERYLRNINDRISQIGIDFSVAIEFRIGDRQVFYATADGDNGFRFVYEKPSKQIDQTLFVPEFIWASVLESKLMFYIIQWSCRTEQHVDYRLEIGRFWFWFEYHVDLNNRNQQALIDPNQHPDLGVAIRPGWGVFENRPLDFAETDRRPELTVR